MTVADPLADLADRLERRPVIADQGSWARWLHRLFPRHTEHPFAEHHAEFWTWLWAIEAGQRPDPFVAIWPRGGAKSTSAELACVALGARRKRRYGLYVCATQDRADDHVGNVGALLETATLAEQYPDMARRAVGKYGTSKGWRRNRLRTASGFTLDAIGLDVAGRGVKLEDQRPDFLVVDDIDGRHDSAAITRRKLETLAEDLIPAGAADLAIVAIQNLVQPNGVFARIASGRTDMLARRRLSGPIPALRDFHIGEDGTLDGTPTWAGQSLDACRALAADIGVSAFRREAQHDVDRVEGALWSREQLDAARVDAAPDMARVVVAVDPSGGDSDGNDEQGIVVAGRGVDGQAYVLADRSCRLSPDGWGRRAVQAWLDFSADRIVGEANYGGDMVVSTVRVAARSMAAEGKPCGSVPVDKVTASRGKAVRAEPVAALYGDPADGESWARGVVHHVGVFDDLEDELVTWTAESGRSPNRLDALVWALTELMVETRARRGGLRG